MRTDKKKKPMHIWMQCSGSAEIPCSYPQQNMDAGHVSSADALTLLYC